MPAVDDLEQWHVLRPQLPSGIGGQWAKARQKLKELGIQDLHSLRREINRRLVPEGALRGILRAANKEGRLPDAALPAASRRDDSWPLPSDEGALLQLGQRVLELEALRDLLRGPWPRDEDRLRAYAELLAQGLGSPAALCEHQVEESSLLQGQQLAALKREAWERAGEDEARELWRRCELLELGDEPFLATAPHNAFLCRDGQPMHTLEEYTRLLACSLARELGGSALFWSQEAQWRTELCYALGHRRKAMGSIQSVAEALDPSNRDPNFLLPQELPENAWFCKLRGWAAACNGMCALHVDVHGCQDPPKHPAHVMLGLAAMRQHAESLPHRDPKRYLVLSRMEAFARGLDGSVAAVVGRLLRLPPQKAAVITGLEDAVNERGEHIMTLSGAWPPEMLRLTQTQQSVSFAGVSHALQLELSRTLRHALMKDEQAVADLARAIHTAWLEALQQVEPEYDFA